MPTPDVSLAAVMNVLARTRFPLASEAALQRAMFSVLSGCGLPVEREVRLSEADRIDFMVGTIGVEVKIKGARSAIYKQCARYCAHERVEGLILASTVPMGLPPAIGAKPLRFLNLGRAWL